MVTVISTNADPVPVVLVAVMVYVVLGDCTVPAPEIIPVLVSKLSPAGNAGLTANELTTVPFLFGTKGVMETVS